MNKEALESNRFGYISSHLVLRVSDLRSALPEWKPYANLRFEVQVRTVLQHAWSAVSHALQYKQEAVVPSALQRRLARIAGIFELADEEFVGIRDQRANVKAKVEEAISAGDVVNISLDFTVMSELFAEWDKRELTEQAAEGIGFSVEHHLGDSEGTLAQALAVARSLRMSVDQVQDVLGNPDINYLRRLSAAREDEDFESEWEVDGEFLFLLLLINATDGKMDRSILLNFGWDESIADRVLRAAEK